MRNLPTLGILLLLTLLTAFASTSMPRASWLALVIMGFAMTKFLLVAFQFMELKKAHLFWKSSVVLFSITFFAVICVLVYV